MTFAARAGITAHLRAMGVLLVSVMMLAAFVSACHARNVPETMSLSPERWRQDLAFLAAELPRRHKNAFHAVSHETFAAAVAELDARIPGLEGHEVVVEMLRLSAIVGDLHTMLKLPSAFRRYPFQLEWFEDELRITGAAEPYRAALGRRIVAIQGVGIGEVARRVRPLTPQAENQWTFLAVSPSLLVRPEVLHALGIIPRVGPVQLRVATEAGEEATFTIEPIASTPAPTLARLEAPPLYRQRPDENFWSAWLPEQKAVYVNFRGYDDFGGHARKLLAFIDAHPTRRIIIDMRNNTGGDFTKVREQLIPGLKSRGSAYAGGNLFVIIGRRTLSAAMTNAIDLKTELGAVLVGEPTGERPNSYQEGRDVQLPHSGLRLSYSTRYYRFLPRDEPAVMPDKPVRFTWERYRSGRDPALDLIAGLPLS